MIVRQYIRDFEKMGFGMFVHFGIYSLLSKGEWVKHILHISDDEYYPLYRQFNPKENWADELVKLARDTGCRYVTLTARHHDGFSLYDTTGLNDFDSVHGCGRDLVLEFVNACRKYDIVPFFYHTLLDWHEPSYRADFPKYLKYLRDSVEILCQNYGKIGGLWFDGMWDRPGDDWEEDLLYSIIRRHQPEAMIINNTGLSKRGKLGHIEIDSVTFERGKPSLINLENSPKYVASEMCEVLADHWGYAKEDLNYKSPAFIIREIAECRRNNANMLLNVGPMGDGSIRPIDREILGIIGEWVRIYDEAIRDVKPTGIEIKGKPEHFILKGNDCYYLFCPDLSMVSDPNVALYGEKEGYVDSFKFGERVKKVTWLDNDAELKFEQNGDYVTVYATPFEYGRNLVVRVAKIEVAQE